MKAIISLLIIFSFLGCKLDECEVEQILSVSFKENIEPIKKFKATDAISPKVFRAIFFFENLTGLSSSVNFGDVSYYASQKDVISDLRKWQSWYDLHKCEVTREQVLGVQEKVKESSSWLLKE